jgi:hypothetical protein
VTNYPLGRIVQHDARSRAYAFKAAPRRLASVTHASHIGILDQGALGSCTGNAVVGALGCDPFYAYYTMESSTLSEAVALKIYSLATTLDEFPGSYPPADTGSSGLAAAKAAQKLGYISGYRHAFNVSNALAALQAGPVITGIDWYESFFTPSSAGLVAIQRDDKIAGGHEVCVDGYDDANQLIWCRNSWTDRWAVGGRFCMTVSTWSQLLAKDGDATILTPLNQPAPVPTVTADDALLKVQNPWAATRHVGSNAKAAAAFVAWRAAKGYGREVIHS